MTDLRRSGKGYPEKFYVVLEGLEPGMYVDE
jgi:hypothetical protein